jgi:hypothetical protein
MIGSVKGHWAIKGGDAQAGPLQVYWDGARAPGYAPMKKQGAIILGIGGDNRWVGVPFFGTRVLLTFIQTVSFNNWLGVRLFVGTLAHVVSFLFGLK